MSLWGPLFKSPPFFFVELWFPLLESVLSPGGLLFWCSPVSSCLVGARHLCLWNTLISSAMQHFLLKCLLSSHLLSCSASLLSFKSWSSPNFSLFYIIENKLHEGTITITWMPREKGLCDIIWWTNLRLCSFVLCLTLFFTQPWLILFFSILSPYFQKFAPGCHVDTSKLTYSALNSWLSFLPLSKLHGYLW